MTRIIHEVKLLHEIKMNNDVQEEGAKPRKQVNIPLRNVILLGVGHCLIFLCFFGTKVFATSLNKDLGFTSLGVLYGTFAISNFFAPAILVKLGFKASLIVGALTYAAWIGTNIEVNEYAIIAVSVVNGIGSAMLMVTQMTFMTKNASPDEMAYFSSIFVTLFQLSNVISYLLATILLYIDFDFAEIFIVFLVIGAVAPFIFLFLNLDSVKLDVDALNIKTRLRKTFLQLKDKKILLLISMFVYLGAADSWYVGIFPPLMNIRMIPLVMLCYGTINCLWSFALGRISLSAYRLKEYMNTRVILTMGAICMAIGLILTMIVGDIVPDQIWMFYLAGCFYGLADSSFKTQLFKIIKSNFPHDSESSIGVCRFFQYSSVTLFLFIAKYIPVHYMAIIIAVLVSSAIVTYTILEVYFPPVKL